MKNRTEDRFFRRWSGARLGVDVHARDPEYFGVQRQRTRAFLGHVEAVVRGFVGGPGCQPGLHAVAREAVRKQVVVGAVCGAEVGRGGVAETGLRALGHDAAELLVVVGGDGAVRGVPRGLVVDAIHHIEVAVPAVNGGCVAPLAPGPVQVQHRAHHGEESHECDQRRHAPPQHCTLGQLRAARFRATVGPAPAQLTVRLRIEAGAGVRCRTAARGATRRLATALLRGREVSEESQTCNQEG